MNWFIDNSRVSPQELRASIGENVTFSCKSKPFVKWKLWDSEVLEAKNLPSNAVVRNNLLHIYSVTEKNNGQYECLGNTEEIYKWSLMRVKFAARVSLIVGEYSSLKNINIQLNCDNSLTLLPPSLRLQIIEKELFLY